MVSIPLKNISQLGWLFPIYSKKTCSKPPTRWGSTRRVSLSGHHPSHQWKNCSTISTRLWIGLLSSKMRREFAMWAMHGHAPQMVLAYSMLKWDIKQIRVQHPFSLAEILTHPCHLLQLHNKVGQSTMSPEHPKQQSYVGSTHGEDPATTSSQENGTESTLLFFLVIKFELTIFFRPPWKFTKSWGYPKSSKSFDRFRSLVLKQPWQLEDPPF